MGEHFPAHGKGMNKFLALLVHMAFALAAELSLPQPVSFLTSTLLTPPPLQCQGLSERLCRAQFLAGVKPNTAGLA